MRNNARAMSKRMSGTRQYEMKGCIGYRSCPIEGSGEARSMTNCEAPERHCRYKQPQKRQTDYCFLLQWFGELLADAF